MESWPVFEDKKAVDKLFREAGIRRVEEKRGKGSHLDIGGPERLIVIDPEEVKLLQKFFKEAGFPLDFRDVLRFTKAHETAHAFLLEMAPVSLAELLADIGGALGLGRKLMWANAESVQDTLRRYMEFIRRAGEREPVADVLREIQEPGPIHYLEPHLSPEERARLSSEGAVIDLLAYLSTTTGFTAVLFHTASDMPWQVPAALAVATLLSAPFILRARRRLIKLVEEMYPKRFLDAKHISLFSGSRFSQDFYRLARDFHEGKMGRKEFLKELYKSFQRTYLDMYSYSMPSDLPSWLFEPRNYARE